jgi:hypothetical protein
MHFCYEDLEDKIRHKIRIIQTIYAPGINFRYIVKPHERIKVPISPHRIFCNHCKKVWDTYWQIDGTMCIVENIKSDSPIILELYYRDFEYKEQIHRVSIGKKKVKEDIIRTHLKLIKEDFKITLLEEKEQEIVNFCTSYNYMGRVFLEVMKWLIYYYLRLECKTSIPIDKYSYQYALRRRFRSSADRVIHNNFGMGCSTPLFQIKIFRKYLKDKKKSYPPSQIDEMESIMKNKGYCGKPSVIVSAIAYILTKMNEENVSQREIADYFDTTEASIRKWYRKILEDTNIGRLIQP